MSLIIKCLTIILALTILPCLANEIHKDYYLDPAYSVSSETGTQEQPFKDLSKAFEIISDDLEKMEDERITITLHCKEGTKFTNLNGRFKLSRAKNNEATVSLRIAPQAPQNEFLVFEFDDAEAHAAFNAPGAKLIFEKIKFEVKIEGKIKKDELILIDGDAGEFLITNCQFRGLSVNHKDTEFSVVRMRSERILIKKSVFENIDLTTHLFFLDDTDYSVLRFEYNELRNINIKNSALLAALGADSLDFIHNDVKGTVGQIVNSTSCASSMIYQNTFEDLFGKYPIGLVKIENAMISANKFTFAKPSGGKSQGLIYLEDFNVVRVANVSVEGYNSDVSAIYFANSKSENEKGMQRILWIEDSMFIGNILSVQDNKQDQVALIKGDSDKKLEVTLKDCVFEKNKIRTAEGITTKHAGASILWASAKESTLKIMDSNFKENSAEAGTTHIFADVSTVFVNNSHFTRNIKTDTDSKESGILISAPNVVISQSHFIDNTASYGGALSFISKRKVEEILIDRTRFIANKASVGGALYFEILSAKSEPVILQSSTFEDNEADEGTNYNKESEALITFREYQETHEESKSPLKLKPGFWRNITEAKPLNIFYCAGNGERCIGGFSSSCAPGYTGPLCGSCKTKEKDGVAYRRYLKDYCKDCTKGSIVDILADLVLFTLPIVFLSYTLLVLLDSQEEAVIGGKISRDRSMTALLINLLVKFMRTLFVLNTFGMNFPKFMMYFSNMFANSTYPIFGYLTCFTKNPLQVGLGSYFILFLIVFAIKSLISCIILKFVRPDKVSFKKNLKVTLSWIFFFESLGFMDLILSLLTCQSVGTQSYLRFDMRTECKDAGSWQTKQFMLFAFALVFFLYLSFCTFRTIRGTMKNETLQTRIQALIFRKSEEFISDGEKSFHFRFFETFGELLLLFMTTLEGLDLFKYFIAGGYYMGMALMNKSGKITFFQGWKSHLYLIENLLYVFLVAVAAVISHSYQPVLQMCGIVASACYGLILVALLVHNSLVKISFLQEVLAGGVIVKGTGNTKSKRRKSREEDEKTLKFEMKQDKDRSVNYDSD